MQARSSEAAADVPGEPAVPPDLPDIDPEAGVDFDGDMLSDQSVTITGLPG